MLKFLTNNIAMKFLEILYKKKMKVILVKLEIYKKPPFSMTKGGPKDGQRDSSIPHNVV